jgi:uncharacterized protein (TIRG00374 family)
MEPPTPPHAIRRSILLAKFALSGLLLALLFWRVDRAAFLRSIQTLPISLFLGCVALFALSYVVSTLRWRGLLQAEGIRLPFWRLLLVYFEGSFFNLFLPTLIGGDIVRGYFIYKMTRGNDAAIASLLVDRLSGFATLMVIAVGSLAVAYRTLDDPLAAALILGPTVLFAGLMLVMLNDRLRDFASGLLRVAGLARFQAKLLGLVDALHRYRCHHRALGQALLWSTLLQVLIIVTYYLIGVGLDVGVPLGYFFVLVPLVTVVSMLPISVAGLGVREAAVVYFFAKLGVDAGAALGMSLVWFSLTLIVCGSGGVAFLLDTHAAKRIEE